MLHLKHDIGSVGWHKEELGHGVGAGHRATGAGESVRSATRSVSSCAHLSLSGLTATLLPWLSDLYAWSGDEALWAWLRGVHAEHSEFSPTFPSVG